MHCCCALVVRADARTSLVTCEWTNESKYFGFNTMDAVRKWVKCLGVTNMYRVGTSSSYYDIYTFSNSTKLGVRGRP